MGVFFVVVPLFQFSTLRDPTTADRFRNARDDRSPDRHGGVPTIEEAYRSVEWKGVFLIAGLIPIGTAMEESGAASVIAETLVATTQGVHPFLILFSLGLPMIFFPDRLRAGSSLSVFFVLTTTTMLYVFCL